MLSKIMASGGFSLLIFILEQDFEDCYLPTRIMHEGLSMPSTKGHLNRLKVLDKPGPNWQPYLAAQKDGIADPLRVS